MIVVDCVQGEEDWWLARTGIPTASGFSYIVTPPDYRDKYQCGKDGCSVTHTTESAAKKCGNAEVAKKYRDISMRMSDTYYSYRNKLLAEWLRGKPDEGFQSEWMKRGHEVEQEARDAYAFLTDNVPREVGLCKTDDGRYGASPDGLIDEVGGLECKSPSPGVHLGYLLEDKIPRIYQLQMIGGLLVTGYEWWDFISYHPDMEPFIKRMYRKDVTAELEKLSAALDRFCDDLDKCKQKLKANGYLEAA